MLLMFKLLEALKCCELFKISLNSLWFAETFEIVMRLVAFIL